jgi:hypothetical protein
MSNKVKREGVGKHVQVCTIDQRMHYSDNLLIIYYYFTLRKGHAAGGAVG